jgi:cyclohexanone monooxygenase
MSEILDFDPIALREKYRHERDQRLRPDGNDQYVEVAADFRHYIDDPHVEPGVTRKPLTDAVDVVIVGGGFGGLLAAARLQESGVKDIRIIEKGGDFGGTWYWNRYPGARCDIESYIYLPLLEETGYIPKEKYSFGDEIRAHARRIGEKFDLYRLACFQTEISEIRWLQEENRWLITTNRGDAMHCRFVVISSGPLNRPKLPGIPGIKTFKGHSFHTSRWDYGYTGGTTEGGLTRLADKRVAIIGTGATAIQCVPHLGRHAKHLYVFQRTPSSVDVRGNMPTDPEWVKTLTPGWQKRRIAARRGPRQRRLDRHLPQPRPRRRGPRGPGWSGPRGTGPDD